MPKSIDAGNETNPSSGVLRRVFAEHPESVNETYLQHAAFALRFSGALFVAAFAALIHALIPCLCETTASRAIKRLHAMISARH